MWSFNEVRVKHTSAPNCEIQIYILFIVLLLMYADMVKYENIDKTETKPILSMYYYYYTCTGKYVSNRDFFII